MEGLTPGLVLLAPLVAGVVVALLMAPLHAAGARRRRLALLVDRVVTDRVARLNGADRRRAVRHLQRRAGVPGLAAVGLTLGTALLTVLATVAASWWWGAEAGTARRTLTRQVLAALDAAGLPSPGLASATTTTAVVLAAVVAVVVATSYVGGLDLERRRAMPATRPWPLRRRRATLVLAVVTFLVLLAVGTAPAAGLFLVAHQVVTRMTRSAACRDAPAVPEALRAARLPGPRERRLLGRGNGDAASGAVAAGSAGPGSGGAGRNGAARTGAVPSGATPLGATPAGAAPSGAAPSGAVPSGRAAPSNGLPPHPAPASGNPPPAAPVPRTPVPHTRLVDMAPAELALRPHDPRVVGEYRLTGRLGSGGMGTVYLGHRAGTAGSVAIKVLAPHLLDDVDARTRFLQEGKVLQQVTGDYTARVLGVGFDGSMPYIVMERLDGPSLHAFVVDSGAVADGEMLTRTAIALARALAALHADGITHRDLKPGNILLTSAGPKVVDFGIAKVVGQTRHTPVGNMVGTPGYMAPEQVTGNVAGPASDVWAWACCVVFAARGDHLFDGENIVDIARQILDGPPADAFAGVARVAPRLVPVLRRATAQESADRPRDGAALLRLLDRSGATATVGTAAWDRLVGGGVR